MNDPSLVASRFALRRNICNQNRTRSRSITEPGMTPGNEAMPDLIPVPPYKEKVGKDFIG
jgi:hypothetical protein